MIVVDTHVLIWSVKGPSRLSRAAASAMRRERTVVVPAILFWELAMLGLRERVRFESGYAQFVRDVLSIDRIRVQPLTPEIGLRAAGLSLNRPMDPADQLIAATAIELNCPLVTADERLKALPGLQTLW